MGRVAFAGAVPVRSTTQRAGRGVRWGDRFASWADLVAEGRRRAAMLAPGGTYVVDPSAGLDGIAALVAVASVPDTFLLYTEPARLPVAAVEVMPALYEVAPLPAGAASPRSAAAVGRGLIGVLTSGTSGDPKVPVLYADQLELIALTYESNVYAPLLGGRSLTTLATCLPLQFSAAFFMVVVPALFLGLDLVVFPPHNWRLPVERAIAAPTAILAVPALAGAAAASTREERDLGQAALLLGGGYVTEQRVATLRRAFGGIAVANIYGTAETGAMSVDPAPGSSRHVGKPVPGKPVWITDPNPDGVGLVTTTGPDCRQLEWSVDDGLAVTPSVVSSTDYGHFDGEGHLYLDGRVDGGEKLAGQLVYPRVVERHILDVPGVVDVRVRVDRTESGVERLVADVVGSCGPDEVREHCSALDQAHRPTLVRCVREEAAAPLYSRHGKL